MHIKICGITTVKDALLCRDLGVDFIGLIRATSERQAPIDRAAEIVRAVGGEPRPVLLYRNATLDEIIDDVRRTGVSWVQLHGAESAAYIDEFRTALPKIHMIRAVEIRPGGLTLDEHAALTALCENVRPDVILFDRPKGAGAADHQDLVQLAESLNHPRTTIWCAGGLNPENVSAVAQSGRFSGVDVARGVERAPGVKSPELVRRFVERVRQP